MLKSPEDYDLDTLAYAAMLEKGFIPGYSEDIKRELKTFTSSPLKDGNHPIRDLREKLWFSIDNEDSKDLDQLTTIEEMNNGSMKVFVAIADVTTLVSKRSAINMRAQHNTTSVYTPTEIFPMLPVELSTNLTSLNPYVDRLSVVTEFVIDAEGMLKEYEIYQALVHNKAKLDYTSVGKWLEQGGNPPAAIANDPELTKQIEKHDKMAQRVKQYRTNQGMLSLSTVEARPIVVNKHIVDIKEVPKNRAREIIEYCMISANTAATLFLHSKNFPVLKRVVRTPKRWERIVELALEEGFKLPEAPDSNALEDFLKFARANDPERFPDLSLAIIKLLGRGEYILQLPGEKAIGHFGLALANYSHSTAPNRRYPDLITQRLLKAAMRHERMPYSLEELQSLAAHCSLKEADADKVTRRMQKSAAALLLLDKIGNVFSGFVTGSDLTKGCWVRILTPPVEGKIVRGFEKIDVGDRVQVRLLAVDVPKGFIDFALVRSN